MDSKEIRQSFLNYFENLDHTIVQSSAVVPYDDPTLLFTNAGMNQFKNVLLGYEKRDYARAASVQKCIRAGGKHNDLENVGKTNRHLTFFEMLGNWSFGDYYKEKAIKWAWEYLTEKIKLSKKRLWISIYKDDDESFKIWNEQMNIPADRIIRLGDIDEGDEENFWSMGDTGPCGPCTEIHYDTGNIDLCDEPENCNPDCDCGRFIEVWNNVFMEFNRDTEGKLSSLPMKSVDTGLGFERLCALLQGVGSIYDTDLFEPIMTSLEKLSRKKYRENLVSFRVIADHIRCLVFAISDGAVPANDGRGYVLRRILRRASRYGKKIGLNKPFIYKLVEAVITKMGEIYPEIIAKKEYVKKIIKSEEERFLKTIDKGLEIYNEIVTKIRKTDKDVISGASAFVLFDTYGFPIDLTKIMAEEDGLKVDEEAFEKEMENQRRRSKEKSKFGQNYDITDSDWIEVSGDNNIISEFVGYTNYTASSKIIKYRIPGEDYIEVILDKTPFYAESGGQVGDTGRIYNNDFILEVIDTIKTDGLANHVCKLNKGELSKIKKSPEVKSEIDVLRRSSIEKNHTATHLLHKTLKDNLGVHVSQAGSLVTPDRFRFDFIHFEKVDEPIIKSIEKKINSLIQNNHEVKTFTTTLDEAKKKNVTALFGEKYSSQVRVVSVDDYSKELCGGAHVRMTGEIGLFKITNESSVSAGVRRIEAVTGEAALNYYKNIEREFNEISQVLDTNKKNILNKIKDLLDTNRDLEKKIDSMENKFLFSNVDEFFNDYITVDDVKIVTIKLTDFDMNNIRKIADEFKNKFDKGIIVIANISQNKVAFICAVTKNISQKFPAGKIIGQVAKVCGGGGGGRSDFAQAGGSDASKVDEAFRKVKQIIEEFKN